MSESNKAMETLTAQWYNAVVTGIGLDDQKFQLYQGPNSLMSTSQDMWNLFSAIPPKSVNNYYDPAQANNFAPNYNEILVSLVTNSDSDFKNCMGDYYAKWTEYFKENLPDEWTVKSISGVFNKWAMINAPSKSSCGTALTKALINPINIAQEMFAAAEGKYAWNKTIESLKSALAGGGSKSFSMNSKTESSSLQHTWAKGSTSIFFDIFSFGGGASYDKLTQSAISEGLEIEASFEKVTTFAAGPYAQKDENDPILSDLEPWYMSAALSKAYKTKDNTVWNNQAATTWETAFGSDGFFQRMATAIVAADGVSIKMTSTASYSSSEQEEIRGAAKAGVWPFFTVSGQGGSTTKVTFDDYGRFTSETTIAKGNPQILGVLQSSMADVFG